MERRDIWMEGRISRQAGRKDIKADRQTGRQEGRNDNKERMERWMEGWMDVMGEAEAVGRHRLLFDLLVC
jgi:hypothetical protein